MNAVDMVWAFGMGVMIAATFFFIGDTLWKRHEERYWAEVDRRAEANTYRVDRS